MAAMWAASRPWRPRNATMAARMPITTTTIMISINVNPARRPFISTRFLRGHQVVVRRDNLPSLPPPHPYVGEPVAPLERTTGSPSLGHQPAGDDGGRAEGMDL